MIGFAIILFAPFIVAGWLYWGWEAYQAARRRQRRPAEVLPFRAVPRYATRAEVEAKLDELSHEAARMIVEALVDDGRMEK